MGLRNALRQLRPSPSGSASSSQPKCSIELRGCSSASLKEKPKQLHPHQHQHQHQQQHQHQHQQPPSPARLVQVTEQTLQVWRALPAQIRHDPSMASFQLENDRIHGSSAPTDDENENENENDSNALELEQEEDEQPSFAGSDFADVQIKNAHSRDISTDDEGTTHSDYEHSNGPGNAKTQARRIHHKSKRSKEQRQRDQLWKRLSLLLFWLFAAAALISVGEKHLLQKTIEVPQGAQGKFFKLLDKPTGDFRLKIHGAFNETAISALQTADDNETLIHRFLIVQPQISVYDYENHSFIFKNILSPWQLPLLGGGDSSWLERSPPVVARNLTYKMTDELSDLLAHNGSELRLHIYSDADTDLAIVLNYNPLIVNVKMGTVLAACILLIFYALLVWEVFERAFVAIVCSILSVTVLACFNDRPNMDEIIQWMDMELLTLLFCMMLLILILTETGVFDYLAVFCFEISGGKIWPMIYSLCLVTCLVSSVLDNMTTVLLLTPVAIRLCEVMRLDPVPVIMGIIVHANIGGALTPIGDPISIIVSTNHYIAANGVTFMTFVEHTLPGVVLAVLQSCLYLRIYYYNMDSLRLNEPKELKELRREIKVWQRAANAISSYSKDADLVRGTLNGKVKQLKRTLRRKERGVGSTDAYVSTLEELKQKYPIKNKLLLMQAAGALGFVIVCFFIQSVPHLRTLPLGWVALLGVILLLIILNRDDMEHLMHRIEWTTLLFFAAMFVMMECVERLGLFSWIGELTEHVILIVDKRHRLAIAIFMILWISALASAILDSIPVTAMMVKLLTSLVAKESLGLPLHPLVWALTLGASFGGNGTLYGASSNVISAGIAEQHGYKLSFTRYLKTVLPMMLGQVMLTTVYLLVAHIVFEWH